MSVANHFFVAEKAKLVLSNASSILGIKASLKKDNYGHVWAPNSAVHVVASPGFGFCIHINLKKMKNM